MNKGRERERELKAETNSQEADGLKPQTGRDRGGRRREESEQREKVECAESLWTHSIELGSSIQSKILLLELLGGQATHKGMQRPRERFQRARVESQSKEPRATARAKSQSERQKRELRARTRARAKEPELESEPRARVRTKDRAKSQSQRVEELQEPRDKMVF